MGRTHIGLRSIDLEIGQCILVRGVSLNAELRNQLFEIIAECAGSSVSLHSMKEIQLKRVWFYEIVLQVDIVLVLQPERCALTMQPSDVNTNQFLFDDTFACASQE